MNKERVDKIKQEIGYNKSPDKYDKRIRCKECDFSMQKPQKDQDHLKLVCYFKKSEFTVAHDGTCDYGEVGIF